MAKLSVVIRINAQEQLSGRVWYDVCAQLPLDAEILCLTDSSLTLRADEIPNDLRIRILSCDQPTAGDAKNQALAASRGEYVLFLDPDDTLLPYACEVLCRKADRYETDILIAAARSLDPENTQQYVDIPAQSLSALRPGDFHRMMQIGKDSPLFQADVSCRTVLFRRSFLMAHQIHFDSLSFSEDRLFFYHALCLTDRIMFARDALVCRVYRKTPPSEAERRCRYAALAHIADALQAHENTDRQEWILSAEYQDLIGWVTQTYLRSEEKTQVIEEAERFVSRYSGPFSHLLTAGMRDLSKKLSGAGAAEKPLAKHRIFTQAPQTPKVSVVVPVYNVEHYLNEALHSLMNQTLDQMEFVCVNDGSTDGSLTILKEYAALDARFRILDGPNGGYGKAMNRGIDAARGTYLGILESDDFAAENMYETLYQAAEKSGAEMVKSDFYRFRVRKDGSIDRKRDNLSGNQKYYNRVLCPGDDLKTFNFVMNTWSGIYRLDFLNRWHIRHNETPGASFQDNGFWFQTFCRAQRAYFIHEAFYMYRQDNPGSSVNSRGKMYCFTDEYRFIQDWMEQDAALKEKYERIFYSRKFNAFIRTYRRLAPEYQLEYLRHIRDEFREPLNQGLMEEQLMMNPAQWQQLNEIVPDPDAYHAHICVSVIVPVYNAAPYLRRMLDSILMQNEIPYEVICVDDGSTDTSLQILQEYEANDSRLRVLRQKNAGAGAARNRGLDAAKGEYLAFLDADDYFEPQMLRVAYERAHRRRTDISVFRCNEYDEETGTFRSLSHTIRKDLLPAQQPFAGTDIRQDIFKAFVGWPWDKLFRTEFVRENHLRFQELRTSNDMLFVFSAIVKAQRITTMNDVMAHYCRHTGSLSVTREKSWDCVYQALCALRGQILSWDLYARFEQDFINYCVHILLWNVNNMQGDSWQRLYESMKESWLEELGVRQHGIDYFYNRSEYLQLEQLLALEPQTFLFWRMDALRAQMQQKEQAYQKKNTQLKEQGAAKARTLEKKISALEGKNRALTEKNQALQAKEKENQTLRDKEQKLRDKNQTLREKKRLLQTQIQALTDENADLKADNRRMKERIDEIYRSTTWRVGRLVLWLPRKLKYFFGTRAKDAGNAD